MAAIVRVVGFVGVAEFQSWGPTIISSRSHAAKPKVMDLDAIQYVSEACVPSGQLRSQSARVQLQGARHPWKPGFRVKSLLSTCASEVDGPITLNSKPYLDPKEPAF